MFFQIKPNKPTPVYPEKSWKSDPENLSLLELVLKFVYSETLPLTVPEKDRVFTVKEETLMKYSIDWWYKAVKKRKEQKIIRFKILSGDEIDEFGADEIELALMKFASLIRKKEEKEPNLMRRINLWKRDRKVDYRKVYDLPGSKTLKDFQEAQITLDQWNRQNPDLN